MRPRAVAKPSARHQRAALTPPVDQLRAKIENYRRAGVTLYEVAAMPDACAHCAAIAAGGPYRVTAPVLPGWPHCKACRCTILALD